MRRIAPITLSLSLALTAVAGRAENWPQWRGAQGQGDLDLKRALPTRMGRRQEHQVEKNAIPHGYSSPIVWGTDLPHQRIEVRPRPSVVPESVRIQLPHPLRRQEAQATTSWR